MISNLALKLEPILLEIEDCLWEDDAKEQGANEYSDQAFRAAMKIFMSITMDKVWAEQCRKQMIQEDKEKQVAWLGDELYKLIKHTTGIDTKKLYDSV